MSDAVGAGEVLIKQSVQDQMLAEISDMRRSNLVGTTENKITLLAKSLEELFIKLVNDYYGISSQQVRQLSSEKLETFIMLVHKRAYRAGLKKKVFWLLIPLFGWVALSHPAPISVQYLNCVNSLKKMLKDSFDPVEILKRRLQ